MTTVGILLVIGSVLEQPSPIKTAANRFYSEDEATQYRRDVELLQAHAFSGMGSTPPGESGLGSFVPSGESGETGDTVPEATSTEVDAAAKRVMDAREKQVAAHANQTRLSRALQGTGIAALCAGALLLYSARGIRSVDANADERNVSEQVG